MRFSLPAAKYPEPAAARNLILLASQACCARLSLTMSRNPIPDGRSLSFRIFPDTCSGWARWTTGNTFRTPSGGYRRNAPPVPYQLIRRQYRTGNPRRVNAVCWHGHRDFFRALFEILPDLKIRTSLATYTLPTFDSRFPSTDRNIGSQISPLYYSEACNCND